MSHVETVRAFIRLVEGFVDDEAAYAGLVHPAMRQTELPNALNPRGQESDWADCRRRLAQGKVMLSSQRYDVDAVHDAGATVVVEARWTGTMAIDAGALRAGQELRARFCMVFDLTEGLIVRARNYDCFEPFGP